MATRGRFLARPLKRAKKRKQTPATQAKKEMYQGALFAVMWYSQASFDMLERPVVRDLVPQTVQDVPPNNSR